MADQFASREDYVTCLQQVHNGAPNPSNILDYVNPFNYHPKDLPDEMLYLGIFDLSICTYGGYWQQSGEEARIVTISATVGWMKKLEFFEGQAPNASRTDWTMQVYRLDGHSRQLCRRIREQITARDGNLRNSQNNSEGSQVVSGNEHGLPDRNPSTDDINQFLLEMIARDRNLPNSQNNPGSQVVSGNEHSTDDIDQAFLEMIAVDRNLPNSQNNSGSQVVSGNEHGLPDRNPSTDGGFLELNDFYGYESSTSGGENSSRMAITSDENMDDDFNSEASLSDQESRTGRIPQQNLSRCTALPTLGADRVVIKFPLSGVQGEQRKGHKDIRVPPKSATAESKTLGGSSVSVPPTLTLRSLPTGLGEPQARPSTSAPRREKKQGSKKTKIGKKFCCCFPL